MLLFKHFSVLLDTCFAQTVIKVSKACVSCMNRFFSIPKVDAILNAILDIWPYQSLGCDVQFPFYEMRKHIASCPHAYLTCPIPDCDQVARERSHLAQHLTTKHSDFITMFEFGTRAVSVCFSDGQSDQSFY